MMIITLWLKIILGDEVKERTHKYIEYTFWNTLRGKKNQNICNGLLLWVHGIFLCPVLSIFNVIRPPLNPDQEHLSTVEGILSLVTAAVWGYSRWPYTQRVAIKWPSPSKNLVKQLIYMVSGKQDRW